LRFKMELLAPAGEWSCLRAAVDSGADAVYFGVRCLNMRARAKNFELNELREVAEFCHGKGIKCYLTLNTIVYGKELERVGEILEEVKKLRVDGVICWDFAVVSLCENLGIPIHLSTQASVSNFEALKVLKEKFNCIKRVVLARELSLEQIREIKNLIDSSELGVEIEVFVHGARCISVSGRCFMSQELFGKSANRGECLQVCRREFLIKDEEGKEMKVRNNFVLSPKDLCGLSCLDKLGFVDGFKIEGRKRDAFYVSKVVSVYRRGIDALKESKFGEGLVRELKRELEEVYNRDFGTGFLEGYPTNDYAGVYGSKAKLEKVLLGKVGNFYDKIGVAEFKADSKGFNVGDKLAFIGPTTGYVEEVVSEIHDDSGSVEKAEKGKAVGVKVGSKVRKGDKVYLIREREK